MVLLSEVGGAVSISADVTGINMASSSSHHVQCFIALSVPSQLQVEPPATGFHSIHN